MKKEQMYGTIGAVIALILILILFFGGNHAGVSVLLLLRPFTWVNLKMFLTLIPDVFGNQTAFYANLLATIIEAYILGYFIAKILTKNK